MTGRVKSWSDCTGSWTEEREERAKRWWADGVSGREIAERLGGVTRSAVIGKMHRLGCACPAASGYPAKPRRRGPKAKAKRADANTRFLGNSALRMVFLEAQPYIPQPEIVIPIAERKTINTLEETHCRWPIGDPKADADFHFCGKSKVIGLSYCEHHVRRAYQPPQPRRVEPPRMPQDFTEPMVAGRQLLLA